MKHLKLTFMLAVLMSMVGAKVYAGHTITISTTEHGQIKSDIVSATEGQIITLHAEPENGFKLNKLRVYYMFYPEPTYSEAKVPKMEVGSYYTFNQITTYYSNRMMLFFGTRSDYDYYAIRLGNALTLKKATKEFMNNTIWECTYLHSTPYRFVPADKVEKEIQLTSEEDNIFSFNMVDEDVIVEAEFVEDVNPTEINTIALEFDENVRIYDVWGNRNNTLKRGLNIVKMNDGTTKKVVVK